MIWKLTTGLEDFAGNLLANSGLTESGGPESTS